MGDQINIQGSSIRGKNVAIGPKAIATDITLKPAAQSRPFQIEQQPIKSRIKIIWWAIFTGVIASLIAAAIWENL